MAAASAIPDVLAPELRVVFCGINPGRVSAAARAHFANPRNDFWRLLHATGFTPEQLGPERQWEALAYGIGITNAAHRTTPGSGDLRRGDFAGAADRLEQLARQLRPAWLAFVGKEAYRGAFGERAQLGPQERRIGPARLFVLPSTSPANAAVPWEERLRWFSELARLSAPLVRPAVRALVLDDHDRVFLHRFPRPDHPGVWFAPGGGIEEGERDDAALRRELREELALERVELGPWVWTRHVIWSWDGVVLDSQERFCVVRVADAAQVRPTGVDGEADYRWWSVDEIEASDSPFAPRRLGPLLRDLITRGPPPEPIDADL